VPVFDGLGRALRWLREKAGLRQYETATAAGITKAMLSAYETGKQSPSLESLEKVLDALGSDLIALHRALDHVNERPLRPLGDLGAFERSPAPGPPPSPAGRVDVRSILGVEELPAEEEAALQQMLDGFHRLLRYLHRSSRSA
jgi:transcriptional regulator with XRE-family HTH domain